MTALKLSLIYSSISAGWESLIWVLFHDVNLYGWVAGVNTHAFLSYLGSLGLFGRLLMRSLLSVPPDGRSGPEPGLTLLIKK